MSRVPTIAIGSDVAVSPDALCEALGYSYKWDDDTNTFAISSDNTKPSVSGQIIITVDGKKVESVTPYELSGDYMVSGVPLIKALGGVAKSSASSGFKRLIIERGDITVTVDTPSRTMKLSNGAVVTAENFIFLNDDRTVTMPAIGLCKALGLSYTWDEYTLTLAISTASPRPPQPAAVAPPPVSAPPAVSSPPPAAAPRPQTSASGGTPSATSSAASGGGLVLGADASNGIYAVNPGNATVTFLSNHLGSTLKVIGSLGDTVYYKHSASPEANDKKGKLYSVKTDGSGLRVLASNVLDGWLVTPDGWIYYMTYDWATRRVRTDGSSDTLVSSESLNAVSYSNGKVFYLMNAGIVGGGEIHSINTDGSGDRLVYKSDRFQWVMPYPEGWLMAASDGQETWVYFTMGTSTKETGHRIKSDGTGLEEFGGTEGMSFLGSQADSSGALWIYYQKLALPMAALARMKADGSGQTVLVPSGAGVGVTNRTDITIIGGWIYFWTGTSLYRVQTNGAGLARVGAVSRN